MVFHLDQFDVMEYLWGTLEKTEDGEHIQYYPIDLQQLWWMGFIDTQRISLDDWFGLLEPYRQEDGTYLLGRDDFLALDEYRYKGEIRIPFDPMLINEGRYTDEGLDELVEASIVPSCDMPRDKIYDFFAQFKNDYRQPDGLILIQMPAKQRIKALLEEHPSPLRYLEILLDLMLTAEGKGMVEKIDQAEIDRATAQAAVQMSRFSSAPISKTEEKAHALDALQKVRKRAESAEVEGVKKVELKRIRRSRKGMRG